jgi:2-polyprenyl-3-methyl-5-hydroxy-6-metoxy-1,4-benzoquinol methylase
MDKEGLNALYKILVKKNDPEILPYLDIFRDLIDKSDLEVLEDLLRSNKWPKAVDSNLICDVHSQEDKFNRAEGILELVVERPLKDKSFLDFGCGEGHVAAKAIEQNPVVSVGYDIVKDDNWDDFDKSENLVLTTNLEDIKKNAPFDVILIYDVLDHMKSNQIKILKDLKDWMKDDGLMYIRFHPFCSRHATHLYQNINKAFVHLIFTEEELKKMKCETPDHASVVHPINSYNTWLKEAGLKTVNYNVLREKVEPFFSKNKTIKERMHRNYKNSPDKKIQKGAFPMYQLEQQFLDDVVKK